MIGYAYLKIFAAATIEISKASLYFFEFVVLMLPDFPSYALLTIIFSFFMEEKKSLI